MKTAKGKIQSDDDDEEADSYLVVLICEVTNELEILNCCLIVAQMDLRTQNSCCLVIKVHTCARKLRSAQVFLPMVQRSFIAPCLMTSYLCLSPGR